MDRTCRPAYSPDPNRVYSFREVAQFTPTTAMNAYRLAIRKTDISRWTWRFTRVRLKDLSPDTRDYVSSLAWFARMEPYRAILQLIDGKAPPDIVAKYAGYEETYLYYETDPDWRKLRVAFLADDLIRVHRAIALCQECGFYWPPILDADLEALDGAHRLAAFWYLYGPEAEIWAWVPSGT